MDGGRLAFEVEGSGHPLLLIHGGLGDLRMWDGQVPVFAEQYQVIRYDTRGFGRTDTDDAPYSNRADAVAVLDHIGAASAYVIGQSRGGMIALDLVLEHPGRVGGFVSVASGVGGYEAAVPPDTPIPPWDEMERIWEAKDWDAVAELETKVWVDGWGQPSTRIDPDLRRLVHGWILSNYRAGKVEGQPQPLDPPAVGRLGEIRVPTLVMVGEADEPAGIVAGRHLAASVAGAQLVEFPGVAHMIQLEQPDRFNQVVLDFLAEVDPGGVAP